jgi:hypothetical protein
MAVNRTNNIGAVGITEGPAEIGYNRERGYYADQSWTGPAAEAKSKLEALVAAGYSPVRMSHQGGDLWKVTAEEVVTDSSGTPVASSPDSYIQTRWSVPGNMLEKDLWQKPALKTAFDAVRTYYLGLVGGTLDKAIQGQLNVKRIVEALVEGQTSVTLITIDGAESVESPIGLGFLRTFCTGAGMATGQADTMAALVESLARGTTAYPVSQWVLKRVMTGPLTSSLRGVRTNVNRMYTTAKLVADESVPSNLLDGIPTGYWLKQTPSVDVENDRLVVSNEWWWAEDYDRFALGDPIT